MVKRTRPKIWRFSSGFLSKNVAKFHKRICRNGFSSAFFFDRINSYWSNHIFAVLKIKNIQDFKVLIENYLRKFKDMFPDKDLIPK